MGLFGKILEKLGIKKEEDTKPAAAKPSNPTITMVNKPVAAEPVKPKPVAVQKEDEKDLPKSAIAHAPASAPMSEVDVVKKLEQMAAGSGLDWKVSIVDLLKILGLDADKDSRIELAKELGCPAELIGGDYSKKANRRSVGVTISRRHKISESQVWDLSKVGETNSSIRSRKGMKTSQ